MTAPRVGLVLGAAGVLGGAWLAGGLAALTSELGWDPATADVVGTSAGSMIGSLKVRLEGLPRAPAHRLARPPGAVEQWPSEALPPGTQVASPTR